MNTQPLDSFESALLTELRGVVAERQPAPRRRRTLVAGAGVAATAAVGAVVALTTLTPQAAFAVDEAPSGDIVVTIHELEDADGLEQALADLGLEATVDYDPQAFDGGTGIPGIGIPGMPEPPPGAEVQEERTGQGDGPVGVPPGDGPSVVESDGATAGEVPEGVDGPTATSGPGQLDVCGFENGDGVVTVTRDGDDHVVTIPPGAAEPGNELRITTALIDEEPAIMASYVTPDGTECGSSMGPATVGPLAP